MDIWLLIILGAVLAEYENIVAVCQPVTPQSFLKTNILEAEVELAKSFSRREKDSSRLLNVSTTEPWTAQLGFDEARPFWAFSQTHILADNSIYRLEGNEFGSMKLKEVAKLPEMILVDGLVFIEVVEWRRILFLMVAFKSDLCKIYTATPSMKITERQKITNVGAKDGEFFTHGNDLYLVVVSSKPEHHDVPSTIYRWTGTHFDIVETFMTSGAVAVSTFPFKGTVIITVAQYPHDKPSIGSQVFRWSHNKLERMQFLPTNGPVALQYMKAYEESYLLVINDYEYSSLYWWTGREFIVWDNFYEVKGMSKISIGYIKDETLILIALKDKIQVYRLLESRLHRLTTVSLFDGEEILSMSLHHDENLKLIAISKKNGALSTSIFNLHIVKGPFGDNQQKMDPLLQCLLSLEDKLLSREANVKKLDFDLPKILSLKGDVSLKGKLLVNGLITIKRGILKMVKNAGQLALSSTASQIFDKFKAYNALVGEAKEMVPQVVMRSTPGHISGKIYFHQSLLLRKSSMESLTVNYLNGKIFDPSNMLRYSSEQKLPGTLSLNTLETRKLNCKELNGINMEDLLLKYGDQHISGQYKVQGLKVNNVQILGKEILNGVKLNSLVTPDNRLVRGKKILKGLLANHLKVSYFHNEAVVDFKDKLVSKDGGEFSLQALKFHSKLIIKSLQVTDLNDIQWDSFKEAVFTKGKNQTISGKVVFNETVRVGDVSADYLNKIPSSEFMTKSTAQEITSIFNIKTLKAKELAADSCNGLDIAADIARLGQHNYVKGSVQMTDISVSNITSESECVWHGIPKPGKMRQSSVYEGPVFISGNLLVDNADLVSGSIKINGSYVDILRLEDDFLMTSVKEVTMWELHATNNLKIVGNLYSRTMKGVDVSNLVHIRSTKEFFGLKFTSVQTSSFVIDPYITVSGVDVGLLLNSTVMTEGDFLVKGKKNFRGSLFVENLQTKWIDGIDVTQMVPLKQQTLSLGMKSFKEMHIHGQIEAENVEKIDIINNHDLSSVVSHAIKVDESFTLDSVKLSTVTGQQIQVSTLNKIDFNTFVKNLDPQSTVIHIKEVNINGEIEFSGPLDIDILNGIDINGYLGDVFNRKTGGQVNGYKKFTGNVVIKNSLTSTFLNEIDMISFEKYHFSKSKYQLVDGYFEMDTATLSDLEVNDINGKQLNIFDVNRSDPQMINADIILSDVYLDCDLQVQILNHCNLGRDGEFFNSELEIVHFKILNATGEITWNEVSSTQNSLSSLFTTAVHRMHDNVISGEVTFFEPAYAQYITTKGGLNGIDLKFIADDCVLKSGDSQVLFGQKIFMTTVNASEVKVSYNANIKWINGLDIPLLNKTLVRKAGFHEVEGKKTFLEGFETEKLECGGAVSDISVSNIVSLNAEILPPVEVQNFWVSENLSFMTVNSMNLSQFLSERITCGDLQEVHSGLAFIGKLVLEGETVTSLINGIYPENAVVLYSDKVQEVSGKKVFLQDVLVEGNADIGLINGYNLTEEYIHGIIGSEDVKVNGNLVFAGGSVINSNVFVNYLVNGIDLYALYNKSSAVFDNIIGTEKSHLIELQGVVEHGLELSETTAYEFMYMDHEYLVDSENIELTHILKSRDTELVAMDILDGNGCGLPVDCPCMRQFNVRMLEEHFTVMPSDANHRYLMVVDESGERGAMLFTNTISRDDECRQSGKNSTNEYSKIVWMIKDDDTGELISDQRMDPFLVEGYISDIKSFMVDNTFYVIVSIYYDVKKSSHSINSLVLKWDDGIAEASVIQQIPTYGAMVLEIIQKDAGIYLFVGNSYDSDLRTRDVNDHIYRLDVEREQFLLLRSMPTSGTNSASSIYAGGRNFIIIGHGFNAPVAIYEFSEEYDNFYFYQNLYIPGSTLSIGVFYVGGDGVKDSFIAVAATDDKIHLFKYNFVEGFKAVWQQRMKGLQTIKPFTRANDRFLAAATLSGINVMRIVVQGS
ncbi:uncharacterized protein LOC124170562 [Ischnura elegans]|uniref:uncharacterized protein LOC124170562 n=1 Tax=Ischnura elegans TaxID=197161 RepID=UPI001ED89A43|nr:uncharacterized protein LOC124170562 [Ischnura elegans]